MVCGGAGHILVSRQTDLAKMADLKVISHTSVMQYSSSGQLNLRNVAAELGVVHLLVGSIQRIGA